MHAETGVFRTKQKPESANYAHIITENKNARTKSRRKTPKKVISGEQTDNKFIYLQYCFSKPY